MLIDTHTHLYSDQFTEDRGEMIQRAIEVGVQYFYLPNIDSSSIDVMLDLEEKWPDRCFPMMGLHPCSVKENYKDELEIVWSWLKKRRFCAVGEIGIDLYWDKTFYDEQIEAFELQINWAKKFEIPIVIHSRDSIDICIEIVEKNKDENLNGVFHCFSGDLNQAEKIVDLDFYMGIGGVSTFKNGGLDKILDKVPLENLVLETDSPYLAPKPYRGKRNESAYLRIIGERVAFLLNRPIKEIEEVTSKNALRLFGEN